MGFYWAFDFMIDPLDFTLVKSKYWVAHFGAFYLGRWHIKRGAVLNTYNAAHVKGKVSHADAPIPLILGGLE